ncbi:MAG: MMPL family transporter [Solirubrobacterales bacterium]|nr:MMPL family transporter [Solirubrobacterales bacterium]
MSALGPIGRAGVWMADHRRVVFTTWGILLLVAAIFAPRVEHALSGAGWEATGSESVAVRDAVDSDFGGQSSYAIQVVVHSDSATYGDPAFDQTVKQVASTLKSDDAVSTVALPQEGATISADGHTAVVQAGAAKNPNEMVAAADDLRPQLEQAAGDGVDVALTGASGMWSDFNTANREAMLKSEVISWPVTLAILVLAFGSLVAAGLPLVLTISGLLAAAGSLWAASQLLDVSIWAMNFALMFALALGIDYALFIVHRFRGALFGSGLDAREATGVAMDTAGKAVMFSGLTVLISLSAVMLVPSPAFRSMSLGIMLSVIFVLAASMTLLPALLGKLGPKVDRLALPWAHSGEHRSPAFARWGERLWRHPFIYGSIALVALIGLTIPVLRLDTGMPSIKVVPEGDSSRTGYALIQDAFGTGAPGTMQIVAPADEANAVERDAAADPGIAQVMPAQPSADGKSVLIVAVPTDDPSSDAAAATIDRLRSELPAAALVGGAATENHDLEATLKDKAPLVIGVVLLLGFVLLLVALQAPLIAAAGVLTNLLATGAAFGVATWLFQDGVLSGPLGFESQGFLDAWAPVFFFAMIFAISMDYTVFLLSSAREHWERSGDPREAMVGGLAHSGRVIFAAAGVMVAVFFTFALSGPLPPKEMGLILGVAVLLDAFLVRLLLVPVLLRLMGKAAWALPRGLDRILPDVSFGHGGEPTAPNTGVE